LVDSRVSGAHQLLRGLVHLRRRAVVFIVALLGLLGRHREGADPVPFALPDAADGQERLRGGRGEGAVEGYVLEGRREENFLRLPLRLHGTGLDHRRRRARARCL
jgi:hypothetical protein